MKYEMSITEHHGLMFIPVISHVLALSPGSSIVYVLTVLHINIISFCQRNAARSSSLVDSPFEVSMFCTQNDF